MNQCELVLVKCTVNQPVAQDAMIKAYQEAPDNDDDEGSALAEAGLTEGEGGEEESAEDDPADRIRHP